MIEKLRLEHKLEVLLDIAGLPRATFYYHAKRMRQEDKYAEAKAEIADI